VSRVTITIAIAFDKCEVHQYLTNLHQSIICMFTLFENCTVPSGFAKTSMRAGTHDISHLIKGLTKTKVSQQRFQCSDEPLFVEYIMDGDGSATRFERYGTPLYTIVQFCRTNHLNMNIWPFQAEGPARMSVPICKELPGPYSILSWICWSIRSSPEFFRIGLWQLYIEYLSIEWPHSPMDR
jgi:hypothetical protein